MKRIMEDIFLKLYHKGIPFLAEMKKVNKFKKLVANIRDKKEYIVHIRNIVLKKIHKVIKFKQTPWLKSLV